MMLDAARRKIDSSAPLSFLNYSKGQVLHRLGLRRHRSGATHSRLTVDESLEYARRVVADYLHYAGKREAELDGARILEVGPGDSLAVALGLIARGARSVTCVDRFEPRRDERHNALVYRRLRDEADPRQRARIDEVLTWSEGRAVIDTERIDCRYGLAVEWALSHLRAGSFDVILSRAVLEHVFDLDATWHAMSGLLAEGGEMWHKVDFRNHGLFAGIGPLYYLTLGEVVWRLATSPDPTLNRQRLPRYERLARETGLDLEVFVTHLLDNEELVPHRREIEYGVDYGDRELATVAAARPNLDARFRQLSDLELMINGVFLICRRSRSHGETSGQHSRPATCPAKPEVAPVRVGFIVHTMQVAGAERLVQEIIRRSDGSIEPTVFCLDAVGELGERLRDEGVPVVCLERRPGLDWRLPTRLARELRRRRIEVVHAQQYTPFFYAALARASGAWSPRVILTEHGRHYPDRVSVKRRWANRWLLSRLADRVTACCDFSRRALVERDGFPAGAVEILPNGIPIERFSSEQGREAVRRRLDLDPARRYVGVIGRLHPVKDHATLLRAFGELCRRREDTDLLVVGDGPLREAAQAQVEELGIVDRVRFLGIRHDVPDILAALDIFALTSLSEAASLTLLEAMAAGLPVVVTEVGGNPEIVRSGVEGYLVPRGDWLAAATALCELLDHPQRAAAMGSAGRRRVERCYRLSSTVESYVALYRGVRERAGKTSV